MLTRMERGALLILLLAATAGAGDQIPLPVKRSTILRECGVTYYVEGRKKIPRGCEISIQKDVYIVGRGSDAVLEDPVGSDPIEGLDAIRAFYRRSQRATGRLRVQRVGPVIVCGREATVHVRAAAHKTGFDPAFDVIYTFACDEQGRIARLRAFFDLSDDTR